MTTKNAPAPFGPDAGLRGVLGTLACRFVVPLWLLAGAMFKLVERNPNLLPPPVLDAVRWLAGAGNASDLGAFLNFAMRFMIGTEIVLVGFMLFVPRLARLVAAATMGLFVLILVLTIAPGVTAEAIKTKGLLATLSGSCGCFGSGGPPAGAMLLIDACLLAVVVACRPNAWGRTRPAGLFPLGAAAASLVVGYGLSFGVPDKRISLEGGGETVAPVEPVADHGFPATPPAPEKLYFPNFGKWVGQKLADQKILQQLSRPLPEGFPKGRVSLVFYRATCEHCFEMMNTHFSGELPHPVIAVAIPEDAGSGKPYPMPCGKCARHTLPKGPEYVVQTPAIVTAEDGTVVAVCTDTDRPGAVEEALMLAKPPATAPGTPPPASPVDASRPFPPMPATAEPFYIPEFEKWKGQRIDEQAIALLIKRPIPIDLNTGKRILFLYRADCDHCHTVLMDHFTGELPAPTLAVAIPDTDPANALELPETACLFTELVAGPQYVVQTPVVAVIEDGVVTCIYTGADEEGILRECLGR
jgi:hypothetical protein